MTHASDTTTLEISLTVENDLEVDSDGRFFVITYIFPDDSEDSVEVRLEFDHIVENLIEFYVEEQLPAGYRQLYLIAHELERHAHNLRDIAGKMEGDHLNGDLFEDY